MLQAVGDRLVVRVRERARLASPSLLLADTVAAKIPSTQGTVESVGARARRFKVGDRVIWGFGAGREFEHEGQRYVALAEVDVIGCP